MNRTEELRQQIIGEIETAIDSYDDANAEYNDDIVPVNIVTARRALVLLKKLEVPIEAKWHYYINDEGRARWRCTNCGRLCKRNPYDKRRCSTCGAYTTLES